ncbi:transcriptional activator of glycolytic enzymes-domain-containing protein [Achaetomium macrosporum]|uniref:Transcriptional activator of glycolytic enzymes-domain-containing protein n=1 Tax=Achaetomium macrosporum TaxID=79813 RepID=A0AAN7H8Y1_9PEZI|nr:transcriptional activator of glycolytic enzymes-domain-containing protein [Achaetomium macrosporum]
MARRTLRKLPAAPAPAQATLPSITVLMGLQNRKNRKNPAPVTRRHRNITNDAELEDNLHRIHTTIHAERPMTTKRAYAPKQAEFQSFCRARGFQDGDTVTESKLLLFLEKEVVYRPLRGPSRKLAPGTLAGEARLHWRSVRAYVTAITDLWQQQRTLGVNSHPSPRETTAREYVRTLQRQHAAQSRSVYTGKGQDTLLDGYSEPELRRIAEKLWGQTAESPANTEHCLRTLTDLLLSHYMLARGNDWGAAEISDLFTFEFPGEGPTRCMPLIFTTRAGKTNQDGRLEAAGALRSRDPEICLLGTLAFYLLFRPRHWYSTRLIKDAGDDPSAGISYNTQRSWVSRAFDYAGVVSAQKTHAGRSSGAKTAELRGVSEAQSRRAGRWNPDQMVGCYLDALPRKWGCFNLPRAVPPPPALLSMIWPELDQWVNGARKPKDLAGTGTVNLLVYLREVVLQDSAFLIDRYPRSPVWSHPVFRHPEYRPFTRRVLARANGNEEPDRLTLLTQALPQFTEHLLTAEARHSAQLAEATAAWTAEIAGLEARLTSAYTNHLRQTLAEATLQIRLPEAGLVPALAPAPAPVPAIATVTMPDLELEPEPALADDFRVHGAEESPPEYRMSRAIKTVEALWQEWMTGLPGQPTVPALDARWGSQWRASWRSEVQWYSLRLEVIREIRRISKARRIAEISAMHTVAADHRQSSRSLDDFCKQLRASRKLREAGQRAPARARR